MKNLILGLGISGKSAAFFLLDKNEEVIGYDDKKEYCVNDYEISVLIDKGMKLCNSENEINLNEIQRIILSPGINPNKPLIKKAKEHNIEIIGEVELAFRNIKNPCIAITGTNGKTTTTLLIAHILNYNEKKAVALGNIGKGILSYKPKKDEIFVIELSSFQLETLQTKVLDVAAILNLSEDHLDRYPNFLEYAKAKFQIQNCIKDQKSLYISNELLSDYKEYITYPYVKIVDFELNEDIFNYIELPKENILFAYNICREFDISKKEFINGLVTFKKVEHRLEFVTQIKDISFYNDSKATNIASVINAINALNGEIILIAGGKDKGFDFTSWNSAFKNKVKNIITIGETSNKIKKELINYNVIEASTLDNAVNIAYSLAKNNENILLSPGCSSYDQFDNFEHRGKMFKEYVRNLERGEK